MLHGAHDFHVFYPFLRLTSPGSIFQEKRCNANTSRGNPFSAHFGFRRGIEGASNSLDDLPQKLDLGSLFSCLFFLVRDKLF